METTQPTPFTIPIILFVFSVLASLAVIIYMAYEAQKEKNERKMKEFNEMSTKLDHKEVEEFLKHVTYEKDY